MTDYPITANDARIQYTATGGQTAFAYDFPIFDEDHIVVTRVRSGTTTTLTITTDYTVGGVGAQAGGTVTLTSGATAGDLMTLYRDVPAARATDYNEAGDFFATALNQDLDLLVMQDQQLVRDLARVLRIAPEDTVVTLNAIPSASARASRFLSFDSSGQPIAATGITGTPVTDAMAPVIAATSLAAGRTALGLGSMATQESNAVSITNGVISVSALGASAIAATSFTATGSISAPVLGASVIGGSAIVAASTISTPALGASSIVATTISAVSIGGSTISGTTASFKTLGASSIVSTTISAAAIGGSVISGSLLSMGTLNAATGIGASSLTVDSIGIDGTRITMADNASLYVRLKTAAQIGMTIDNTSPTSPIGLNINFTGTAINSSSIWFMRFDDSSTTRAQFDGNGNIRNANGVFGTLSDHVLKTNIAPAGSQSSDVQALAARMVNFDLISDIEDGTGNRQLGIIAQSAAEVSPGLVGETQHRTHGTVKTLNTSVMLLKGFKATGEILDRLDAIEARLDALEGG